MAKVYSSLQLSGTIGDQVYYKNEFGNQVRSKGQPSEWHLEHAESYANARRNAAEFKHAKDGAQLFRFAIGELYKGVKNIRLSGRMNGALLKVVKSDPVSEWGKRFVSGGDLSLLEGFEFNHKLSLDDALPLNIDNCYTIDSGGISLHLPAFRIRKKKGVPAKATHYRVVSALITVDFDGKRYVRDIQKSPLYAMGRQAGAAFSAEHTLAPGTTGQFWLVGVEFFASDEVGQEVLKGGALRMMEYVRPVEKQFFEEEAIEVAAVDTIEVPPSAGPKSETIEHPTITKAPEGSPYGAQCIGRVDAWLQTGSPDGAAYTSHDEPVLSNTRTPIGFCFECGPLL